MAPNNIAKPDGNILSENLLSAALSYAELGWPTLPIFAPINGGCSCHKKDCSNVGKHPAINGGWKAASTDIVQLEKWFRAHLKRNIAIATGAVSGVFVLDVDGEEGAESLRKLEAKHGRLPQTARVHTGRGLHYYFLHPPQGLRCSAGKLGRGLDIRGDGGYAILPPSLHQNGTCYEWL